MPTLPKSKHRPWIPKKPKHLREVDNASFYNSKRWRSLRNYFIQMYPLCVNCKRKGEIKNFTGIDSPYEEPKTPNLKINTENELILIKIIE